MNKDLNLNFDLKDIPAKLRSLLIYLKKYAVFICVIAVLGIFVFLVWRIQYYATIEPTDSDVINKVNELNTPRLDQESVNKILLLEDQNIEVKALFNQARQNPFQE